MLVVVETLTGWLCVAASILASLGGARALPLLEQVTQEAGHEWHDKLVEWVTEES